MAKRLKGANAEPARHESGTRRKSPLWIVISIFGISLVVVATGIVSASLWHAWTLPSRIARNLPDPPDSSRMSDVLRARLREAETQATGGPDRLEGVEHLASLYHANGFLPEAAACWSLLAVEQPEVGRWTYCLADLAATAGKPTETGDLLATTVRLAPDYAPAWLKLGDLALKTGDPAAAHRAYERRLALEPDDPYARLGLARLAIQEGDSRGARTTLEEILEKHSDFSAAHNLLAEILAANGDSPEVTYHRWAGRESGRFRKADDPWLDELQAWCYDPGRLRTLGTMANQTGDRENAIQLLTRAVEMSTEDPYGYALLGDAYLGHGEAAAACDVLEEGLAIEGEIEPVELHYTTLAQAYRELGEPEKAIQVVRDGILRIGGSCELYDALGIALGETGAFEEAAAAFAAALAVKPGDANANYNRANALLNLGRQEEALFHLRQSLTLQPTFPKSLFMLARYEMDAGDLEKAGEYLRPLYVSHPEQDGVRQLMVAWLIRSGKEADKKGDKRVAESLYREGLTIDPDSTTLNIDLGVLLLINDRVPEALPLLENYHRLQPDDPQGALFLGQAYARSGKLADARTVLERGAAAADAQGNTRTAAFCREILSQLPGAPR
ncbi:MAG: tetratricopeptide repeat protein [Opitutaceae bacterium]